MLEDILIWVNVGILILLLISLILMLMLRRTEKTETKGITDMIFSSLIIFGVITLFDLVFVSKELGYIPFLLNRINPMWLTTGTNLVLIPLMAVLFLATSFALWEIRT